MKKISLGNVLLFFPFLLFCLLFLAPHLVFADFYELPYINPPSDADGNTKDLKVLNYGEQPLHTKHYKGYLIKNNACATLSLKILGIAGNPKCPQAFKASLPSGQWTIMNFAPDSVEIDIEFNPQEEITYNCEIYIETDGQKKYIKIPLQGKGVPQDYFTDYLFTLIDNGDQYFECDDAHCWLDIRFKIYRTIHNKEAFPEITCPDDRLLEAAKHMAIQLDPCSVERRGFLETWNYDLFVKVGNPDPNSPTGESPCLSSSGTAACVIHASIDPNSIVWSDPENCEITGVVHFEITPAGDPPQKSYAELAGYDPAWFDNNLHRCMNIPVLAYNPKKDIDGKDFIVYPSDISASITTSLNPLVQGTTDFHLFSVGNVVTLHVPLYTLRGISSVHEISAYDLIIRVKDVVRQTQGGSSTNSYVAIVEGFFRSPTGGDLGTPPANVQINNIYWEGVPGAPSGTDFLSARKAQVSFSPDSTVTVRLIVTGSVQIGEDIYDITWKSNKLVFRPFFPCPDSLAKCVGRPPYIRPAGFPPEKPDRPVFAPIEDKNGNNDPETPDYGHYTGNKCPACLFSPEESYVDQGYWVSGVAKEGTWSDWFALKDFGRTGARVFTFVRIRPWELFALCPQAEYPIPNCPECNPPIFHPWYEGTTYAYNACAKPEGSCEKKREEDGGALTPKWYTVWTPYGWICAEYMCQEVIREEYLPRGGKECD